MTDITLEVGNGYFIHKVGAIIIHDNNVLMVKNENHSCFYAVGGRVNFGETSEIAVLREVYEETGINFEIDRLAYVHENYFIADFLDIDDAFCHELALYYLMKQSCKAKYVECASVGADGGTESLHWLPITDLSSYELFPEFYKTELLNLRYEIGHFITRDDKTLRRK
jgi:ADP-ribose pyrophosphatase YjhB (NUDIX family)